MAATVPSPAKASFEQEITLRTVTAIMAAVVALTFLFGFGNVWTLARRLEVPPWVAPLVAPAVDLSVLGLLLGTRYLALHGGRPEQLRPARRLLVFSSVMTLALNVTDPLLAGQTGKAAFDAVGPLLLIGWAEVGPGLLQAISAAESGMAAAAETTEAPGPAADGGAPVDKGSDNSVDESLTLISDEHNQQAAVCSGEDELLERAREEDARHWEMHQRPISAETLRKELRVGAAKSRMLVSIVRSTSTGRASITARHVAVERRTVQSPPMRRAE